MRLPHIEFNHAALVSSLIFDIDDDASDRWEEASLPAPNLMVQNRHNQRGHLIYALASPVGLGGESRMAPIKFLADIQLGMTRLLGADMAFTNRITKNPLHSDWRALWLAVYPYELNELRGWLDDDDVRKPVARQQISGLGRNCDLFDTVRHYAYRRVGPFRLAGGNLMAWAQHLLERAQLENLVFTSPLGPSEVRSVARSVARWTFTRLEVGGLSEVQRRRGKRGAESRWEGHESLDYRRPWEAEGVSRATFFRRRRAAREVGSST